MRSARMRGLLVATIGTCASCAHIPRMPCRASNPWGTVHAESQADADRVRDEVDSIGPQLLAAVPGLIVRPVDLYLVHEIRDAFWTQREPDQPIDGACFHEAGVRWIEVRSMQPIEAERHAIAHELLHHWVGPEWETMPYFVLEGWADYAADVAGHRNPPSLWTDQVLLLASTLFAGIVVDDAGDAVRCASRTDRLGDSEMLMASGKLGAPMPPEDWRMRTVLSASCAEDVRGTNAEYDFSWRRLGYLIAARIGIESMHRICLDAHASGQKILSPDRVLQAAGLNEEVDEDWSRAILDLLGPSEREEIRRKAREFRSYRRSG